MMTENPKAGAVITEGKVLWIVKDTCPPCKLIWCYRVEFVQYKSKKGQKPIVIYKRFKYNKVELIANPPR